MIVLFSGTRGHGSKAPHSTIPMGVRTMYVPCMDKEAEALLDLDIADHLIESLDAARRARWEESPARMHFTHSSQKSWALLRRLSASQRPPQSARPPVSANKVASHLILVTKAPANKAFKRKVCDGWHQARQNFTTYPHPRASRQANWSWLWEE